MSNKNFNVDICKPPDPIFAVSFSACCPSQTFIVKEDYQKHPFMDYSSQMRAN